MGLVVDDSLNLACACSLSSSLIANCSAVSATAAAAAAATAAAAYGEVVRGATPTGGGAEETGAVGAVGVTPTRRLRE